MMRFTVFNRWGDQIGVVSDVIEAVHKDVLNGEDSLTLVVPSCDLVKGDRIVWRDKFLDWHEHVVADISTVHSEGKLYTTVYCENSISELHTDFISDLRPQNVNVNVALQRALSSSRWGIGVANVTTLSSATFYHCSAHDAISSILEAWGGELSTTIEVSGVGVSARKVNIEPSRGADYGKRFEWTKDMAGITREVSVDDVVTALYGYGKGLEKLDESGNATGGYQRKLTFGSVNGGRDYVADEDAKQIWGLPDGNGGVKHTFGIADFPDCEDASELLKLTKAELAVRSKPQVTYTADVVSLADAGLEHEDVRTGDTVAIIDREMGERLQGRVLSVQRYLFNEQATVIELGNISQSILGVMADYKSQLNSLRSRSGTWDSAASLEQSYMDAVIESLNNTINATGGWTYYEPGEGITTYDRPKDQNPTSVIQIKGGSFRIANSKKSNGEWDWRTFGTGDGFTADLITTGAIVCGQNRIDMDTGTVKFVNGEIEITDSNGMKITLSPSKGFQVTDRSGNIIAGTEIENNQCFFYTRRIGKKTNYIQVGTASNTDYGAFEYNQNGIVVLRVQATADSSTGARAGMRMQYDLSDGAHTFISMSKAENGSFMGNVGVGGSNQSIWFTGSSIIAINGSRTTTIG